MKIKTLTRENWSRICASRFAFREFPVGNQRAITAVLALDRVKAPLMKEMPDGRCIKIVDNGYFWLQFGMENTHWWLTVMLDEKKNIVQYYFDITQKNILDGASTYIEDLFLEVVLLPNGKTYLLDEEELDLALGRREISLEDAGLARETAALLLTTLPANQQALEIWIRSQFAAVEACL